MTCHGGARNGAIHGEKVGHGGGMQQFNPTLYNSSSYSGKRMLAGSMLSGVARPSTKTGGACLVKWIWGPDAVDMNTGYLETGAEAVHSEVNNPDMGLANYDYDSAPDP